LALHPLLSSEGDLKQLLLELFAVSFTENVNLERKYLMVTRSLVISVTSSAWLSDGIDYDLT